MVRLAGWIRICNFSEYLMAGRFVESLRVLRRSCYCKSNALQRCWWRVGNLKECEGGSTDHHLVEVNNRSCNDHPDDGVFDFDLFRKFLDFICYY